MGCLWLARWGGRRVDGGEAHVQLRRRRAVPIRPRQEVAAARSTQQTGYWVLSEWCALASSRSRRSCAALAVALLFLCSISSSYPRLKRLIKTHKILILQSKARVTPGSTQNGRQATGEQTANTRTESTNLTLPPRQGGKRKESHPLPLLPYITLRTPTPWRIKRSARSSSPPQRLK
jgi:hypothetical protein